MLVKESNLFLAASNAFLSRSSSTRSSTSSIFHGPKHETTRPVRLRCRPGSRRRYATISGEPSGNGQQPREHVWPTAPKGHSCPTPYQIFAMEHGGEYTKVRFYELVKLYHPDSKNNAASTAASSPLGQLSQQDILERYRLVVSANALLSDPAKRRAYDRFGAGWAGRADFGPKQNARGPCSTAPFSQSWTQPNDPIWQNATWEDWERYYAAKARNADPNAPPEPQGPLYISNSYFIALVALLAVMGSMANYSRAQDAGTYFLEQRDIVHDRASKELRKVRQETATLTGREQRIRWFLRQREATMGSADLSDDEVEALREEKAQRVLPDGEICRAGNLGENSEG